MPKKTTQTSKYLLALETSGAHTSFALLQDNTLISEVTTHLSPKYRDRLAHWIDHWLKELDISVDRLSGIAVSTGPGSFTGLRVGMSVAKGLCAALDIPLWAVPTLEAMACSMAITDKLLCPTTLARSQECYAALYKWSSDGVQELSPPFSADAKILAEQITAPTWIWGEGALNLKNDLLPLLSPDQDIIENDAYLPKASAIARWAVQAINRGLTQADPELEPFYLKQFPG